MKVFFKELKVDKWGKLFKSKGVIASKVTYKKFKNIELDEEDERELDQYLNQKRYTLLKERGELNGTITSEPI